MNENNHPSNLHEGPSTNIKAQVLNCEHKPISHQVTLYLVITKLAVNKEAQADGDNNIADFGEFLNLDGLHITLIAERGGARGAPANEFAEKGRKSITIQVYIGETLLSSFEQLTIHLSIPFMFKTGGVMYR